MRNRNDVNNSTVRQNVGQMSGIVGIVLNILLATAKMLVGGIFGIISIFADGMNNLTDCGSNIVSLIGLKLANKPADSEHPFGHRRMEYIASMVVSFIVLVLAFNLAIESASKVISWINGQVGQLQLNVWIVVALSVSIAVKLWMFVFNRILAKRYDLDLLKATSTDSISDVLATSAVLAATLISHFMGVNLDGIMGVIVSVIIAVAGIKILKSTINQLLGKALDDAMIRSIEQRIKNFDGVLGIHDLSVHNYGPNEYYASVHVEVDASVDVLTSHELMDSIERDFKENTDIVLVTHFDPIVIGDAELDGYKAEVEHIVKSLDEHFNVHDFRMIKGPTMTNLIFDVAIHYDTKLSSREISDYIQQEVSKLHQNVYVVPTVECQLKPDHASKH